MKRLAVFLMIPSLVLLAAAITSAGDGTISGKYAISGSGSCLHSEMPYYHDPDGQWTVPNGSQVYAGVTVVKGTLTFSDVSKTGNWVQTIYATILPGGHVPVPIIPVEVRVINQTFDINYETTATGEITVNRRLEDGGNGPLIAAGSISIDGNAMTLFSANVVQPFVFPYWNTICNTERTLIKVGP